MMAPASAPLLLNALYKFSFQFWMGKQYIMKNIEGKVCRSVSCVWIALSPANIIQRNATTKQSKAAKQKNVCGSAVLVSVLFSRSFGAFDAERYSVWRYAEPTTFMPYKVNWKLCLHQTNKMPSIHFMRSIFVVVVSFAIHSNRIDLYFVHIQAIWKGALV